MALMNAEMRLELALTRLGQAQAAQPRHGMYFAAAPMPRQHLGGTPNSSRNGSPTRDPDAMGEFLMPVGAVIHPWQAFVASRSAETRERSPSREHESMSPRLPEDGLASSVAKRSPPEGIIEKARRSRHPAAATGATSSAATETPLTPPRIRRGNGRSKVLTRGDRSTSSRELHPAKRSA